jgi:hypothetical protein
MQTRKQRHQRHQLFNDAPSGIPKTKGIGYGTAKKARASIKRLKGKPKTLEHNLNVMSSAYHTKPGESGEKYISKNTNGYYVRINNKKYGIFGKQFKTIEEAISARDTFINKK